MHYQASEDYIENQIQTCTGMDCGKTRSQTNTIVFSLSARCDVSSKSKSLGDILLLLIVIIVRHIIPIAFNNIRHPYLDIIFRVPSNTALSKWHICSNEY